MAISYNEIDIVWLDDPAKYPYLREIITRSSFRERLGYKKLNLGKVVGYTVQSPDTTSMVTKYYKRFQRRVWYFSENDPYPGDNYPCQAVIPSSIKVGFDSICGRVKS